MISQLTIVAPGLLGASLAMAARAKGAARRISVYARRPDAAAKAASEPWCDFASADLAEACDGADLIVLCAPVERIISLAQDLAPSISGNPIVTDVGSVKGEIARRCASALAGKARFVGSHPMAGSEKTGMDHASAGLFEGRPCFVTPREDSDPSATQAVIDLWTAIGSRVIVESPDKHDEIVACVSHLPHMLASALATYLSRHCAEAGSYCGNGLRDTTRVAAGDPALWREIISQNRQEILRAIAGFQDHLQAFSAAIANQDEFAILQQLSEGKAFRDRL